MTGLLEQRLVPLAVGQSATAMFRGRLGDAKKTCGNVQGEVYRLAGGT